MECSTISYCSERDQGNRKVEDKHRRKKKNSKMIDLNSAMSITGAFQVALAVKNPPANARDSKDLGLIPGSRRSPGVGSGNPLHYSCWKFPWTEEPGVLYSMGLQSQI